jgi:hypothetical protein
MPVTARIARFSGCRARVQTNSLSVLLDLTGLAPNVSDLFRKAFRLELPSTEDQLPQQSISNFQDTCIASFKKLDTLNHDDALEFAIITSSFFHECKHVHDMRGTWIGAELLLADLTVFPCKSHYFKRPPGTTTVESWIKDCEFEIGGYYPKGKRPRIVRTGDVMFPAVLCEDPWDTLIIGRAFAFEHFPGIDEASESEKAIPGKEWKKDWPFRTRFRDSEFIKGPISQGVSLSEVMQRFGNDAFVSSQIAAQEDPDFKPQKSVRQHPYVRFTYEAAQWVNSQLDLRLAELGTIRPA